MKRSEIVQIIIQELKDNDQSDGPSLQSTAEHILHKLLECGMLPPRAKIPVTIRGIEAPMYDNCWEKE